MSVKGTARSTGRRRTKRAGDNEKKKVRKIQMKTLTSTEKYVAQHNTMFVFDRLPWITVELKV